VLRPNLKSVDISEADFDKAFAEFEQRVNSPMAVTGYCNLTFGKPTHIVTSVSHMGDHVYQARIGFLEGHPDTGPVAKQLLTASLQDLVKWQFAITNHSGFQIFSIEAILETSD